MRVSGLYPQLEFVDYKKERYMKILPVSTNFIHFPNKNNISSAKENTVTSDFNSRNTYTATRISAMNNIAFHGLFDRSNFKAPTAQDKLNAAIKNLDDKSILLFADDIENAKSLLNLQLKNIKFPMQNIYFVKNEYNHSGFAVYKDKDSKYKIFKLHPLGTIMLLQGGTDEYARGVTRDYVYQADEPIELKDKQYIKFGPYKEEKFIQVDFNQNNSYEIFNKSVDKYIFFDSVENAQKFNASRLQTLTDNKIKKNSLHKITFDDIGAQDDVIEQLEQNVMFPILYPEVFKDFRINKGILLYGPPRCGKTMLALALANELGINFIKLSADDLTHANVGKTEENWRNLFKTAIENQPAIIFIDEFDAIAKKRSGSEQARHQDNVVNQLLVLMSDLEKSDDKVFVIAATNRKDLIDGAMIATGRFGLQIEVKEPDLKGTKQIFEKHAKAKPLDKNIDIDSLCEKMYEHHFNGSDIAESFYIAFSNSLRRTGIYDKMKNRTLAQQDMQQRIIMQEDFEKAINQLASQKTN